MSFDGLHSGLTIQDAPGGASTDAWEVDWVRRVPNGSTDSDFVSSGRFYNRNYEWMIASFYQVGLPVPTSSTIKAALFTMQNNTPQHRSKLIYSPDGGSTTFEMTALNGRVAYIATMGEAATLSETSLLTFPDIKLLSTGEFVTKWSGGPPGDVYFILAKRKVA